MFRGGDSDRKSGVKGDTEQYYATKKSGNRSVGRSLNASKTSNSFFTKPQPYNNEAIANKTITTAKSKSQYKSFDAQKSREMNLYRPTFSRANGPYLSIESLRDRPIKPYYQAL